MYSLKEMTQIQIYLPNYDYLDRNQYSWGKCKEFLVQCTFDQIQVYVPLCQKTSKLCINLKRLRKPLNVYKEEYLCLKMQNLNQRLKSLVSACAI
ncbi:unnamed protein product [Paramecium primaurelia]|uniref:Uncharacterized protein n=1 Tax=Paramecium primaurelia TaxID=5886 RepID=A0A8S1QF39_PARPR|nr:unnamed protein product [Paramecium primaurelia]